MKMSTIDFMHQQSFEIWRKKIDCDTGDLIFDEKWSSITTTRERADIMVHALNYGEADMGDPNIGYYLEKNSQYNTNECDI